MVRAGGDAMVVHGGGQSSGFLIQNARRDDSAQSESWRVLSSGHETFSGAAEFPGGRRFGVLIGINPTKGGGRHHRHPTSAWFRGGDWRQRMKNRSAKSAARRPS